MAEKPKYVVTPIHTKPTDYFEKLESAIELVNWNRGRIVGIVPILESGTTESVFIVWDDVDPRENEAA